MQVVFWDNQPIAYLPARKGSSFNPLIISLLHLYPFFLIFFPLELDNISTNISLQLWPTFYAIQPREHSNILIQKGRIQLTYRDWSFSHIQDTIKSIHLLLSPPSSSYPCHGTTYSWFIAYNKGSCLFDNACQHWSVLLYMAIKSSRLDVLQGAQANPCHCFCTSISRNHS